MLPARRVLAILLVALLLAGCARPGSSPSPSPPPTPSPSPELQPFVGLSPRAVFETTKGTIVAELALEMAPRTVENFMDLAQKGFYDGTRFHRVSNGSLVQGGDPNTRSDDTAGWGRGGPGYTIPDEFHPLLRHDAPGILSMATAGPDAGGSQFFFLLTPSPGLDDRNSVFGHVIQGLEVVRAISEGATFQGAKDGRPLEPVTLTKVTIVRPENDGGLAEHAAVVLPVLDEVATDGVSPVQVAVVVRNNGTVRDSFNLSAEVPPGWRASFDDAHPTIPAKTGRVVILTVTPPASGAAAPGPIVNVKAFPSVTGTSGLGFAFVTIRALGAAPAVGANATADYVALLPDGRIFDTTLASVATYPDSTFMSSVYAPRAAYEPYRFTVGAGNVTGFSEVAARTRVGETSVARVGWEDAYDYGAPRDNALYHRDVVFVLRMLAAE